MSACEEIGARIKTLREKKGLTQAELGAQMHTSRELVNQWERGARDLKTGTIIELARFFGVSCDYILTGVEAQHIDVKRTLGLEDSVIKLLSKENERRMCGDPDQQAEINIVDVVNGLLPLEIGLTEVLRAVYRFFYSDFSCPFAFPLDENAKPSAYKETFAFKIVDPLTVPDRWSLLEADGEIFAQAHIYMITEMLRYYKDLFDGKRRENREKEDNP